MDAVISHVSIKTTVMCSTINMKILAGKRKPPHVSHHRIKF